MRTLIFTLLVACTAPSPTVRVHIVGNDWTASERALVRDVGESWDALGLAWDFTTSADRSPVVCPRDWYTRNEQCTIDVGLIKVPGLFEHGIRGYADRATDTAYIDERLAGRALLHVTAHEIGHLVLATGEHVEHGIMKPGSSHITTSPADLALACARIGRGC